MTFNEEHALETFKSLITVAMEGLKALLLINGGAVIALLAFLGQSPLGANLAPHFWWPIGFFVAGVVTCTLAFVASYFTQFSLYNESFPNRNYRGPKHTKCLLIGLLFAFTSVTLFGLGSFESLKVFALKATDQSKSASHQSPSLVPAQTTASPPVPAGPNSAVKRDAPKAARPLP